MDTNATILQLLKEKNEPMKAGEIAEATGLDKKAVDTAIKVLKTEGTIISPKRCYYSPNA